MCKLVQSWSSLRFRMWSLLNYQSLLSAWIANAQFDLSLHRSPNLIVVFSWFSKKKSFKGIHHNNNNNFSYFWFTFSGTHLWDLINWLLRQDNWRAARAYLISVDTWSLASLKNDASRYVLKELYLQMISLLRLCHL